MHASSTSISMHDEKKEDPSFTSKKTTIKSHSPMSTYLNTRKHNRLLRLWQICLSSGFLRVLYRSRSDGSGLSGHMIFWLEKPISCCWWQFIWFWFSVTMTCSIRYGWNSKAWHIIFEFRSKLSGSFWSSSSGFVVESSLVRSRLCWLFWKSKRLVTNRDNGELLLVLNLRSVFTHLGKFQPLVYLFEKEN